MARITWSTEQTGNVDGFDLFSDPKSDETVETFPEASVRFASGGRVCGRLSTVKQRRVL